jgi:hypothetical protein
LALNKTTRSLLTVVIDVLIVIAIALAIRVVILFTGQVSAQQWASAYRTLTHYLVLPLGLHQVKTPYHGVFDVNAAVTALVALLAEWGLTEVRDRA